MICKPSDNTHTRKHFLLVAGTPGVGKSTLALSAPSPLFIDCDQSLYKVNPVHKTSDVIHPGSYEEILEDLKSDLSSYSTIIFDTGGELISFMKNWAIKQNVKNVQRDGMTLSMAGYGAIKREFERLIDYCLNVLNKHIVIICHVSEITENDQLKYRLDVEGSSSKFMWKKADLAAFMNMQGKKRVLGFSPTEQYYAKGAYGISGELEYPYPQTGADNTFIKDLFAMADKAIADESELLKKYQELMKQVKELIDSVCDLESINDLVKQFANFNWLYASRREGWKLLTNKADELGFKYDTNEKQFIYRDIL